MHFDGFKKYQVDQDFSWRLLCNEHNREIWQAECIL